MIGPGSGRRSTAASADRIVALDPRVLAEETGEVVGFIYGFACSSLRGPLDSGEDASRRRIVALEDVSPDPGEHQALEPVRGGDRGPQQRQRAEREPDRVDRTVGQHFEDPCCQVGVLGRVVRLGSGAVTEQVDAEDVTAGVGEQGGEATALPGRRERAAPPVHEDHRDRHDPAA